MNFDFLDEELIKFSKTLNKDIWLGYKLKSKVKNKLLEIAKSFISYLDFDIQIDDILFVGSMANFNFNEDSDIDLHITTDFKKYNFDEDMLINFFNAKKSLYNQNHNITIYNHPVELYIEDSNKPAKSNGKYSLMKNKWLQIPQKINKQIQDVIDNPKYIEFVNKIEVVLSSDFNNDEANDLLNDIYEARKQGLSEDGEYSEGNLIFKKLRSKGYLKKLKDYINDNNDKSLSLTESMNDDVITIAKKYFGTTTNINEAGYILPSGELLDLSGKKYNIKNKGQRRLDHREISSAYNETSYDIDLLKFMDEGCIRWIPEFQQLTITIKPTKKQMAVISKLFKIFGEISVEICRGSNNWGSDKNSMYNDYTKFSMFNKDIETFYGRNEIISENKNEDISFYDSVVDAYEGELSKLLTMNVQGKDVGYIEYSVYDEEPYVQYIFVEESYRRKGYGSKLVRKLQSLYPNSEINFGMTTEDGTKLYNSLEKIITPNPLYTKKQQELKRIKQWMKKFNAIADKDAEDWTEKEIQYLRKYSDIWQKYHNRVQDIEKWLEDNKKQTVRIKVDESNNFLSKNVKFITSSSQLLSILKSQNGGYRILYDKNLDMYMVGHEEEVIHQDMLEYAYKSGLYYNMEEFIESLGSFQNYIETGVSGGWDANDNEIDSYLYYMIFDPYNEWKIGDDEYDNLYKLKFGNLLTRNCDIKDIPLYNLLVSKKEINESLYYAEMLKNGQMFEIYKNPTYNEFWDLMKYSKEKVLRGICGTGRDTNLYVWDAYYGGMHSDVLDKYIKSDDTINTHSFVQIYFRPNRDIKVHGSSLALNNIIEKYYGKEEDSHKSLQSIFDDDDLGLLNETQEPKLNDNFKKWFGNSKVVDSQGKPLVVYHGSPVDFNEFDKSKQNKLLKYGQGFYFTSNKQRANLYGEPKGFYLRINNPITKDTSLYFNLIEKISTELGYIENPKSIEDDIKNEKIYASSHAKANKIMIEKGYDGIILYDEYIVFNPNQIKSVNNNGNWSLEVDNINESKEVKFNDNFKKWFGNSKCVDENGNPKVFIHRSNAKFNAFDKSKIGQRDHGWYGKGFYFGSAKQKYYQLYGKHVYKCFLRIENPFYYNEFFGSYHPDDYQKIVGYDKLGILTPQESKFLKKYMDAYNHFDSNVKLKKVPQKVKYNRKEYDSFYWVAQYKGKTTKTDPDTNPKYNTEDYAKEMFWIEHYEKYVEKIKEINRNCYKTRMDKFSDTVRKMGYDGIIHADEYVVFEPNQIKSVKNNGDWSLTTDNINEGKSFFTDSGIIDTEFAWEYDFKNGQPTTVEAYHMTPYKFTSFKIGQVNAWGKGVYLTTDPKQCSFNPKIIMDWYKMRLYATFYKPFVYERHISEESINWFINEIKQVLSENDLTKTNINEMQLSSEKTLLDTYLNIIFKNFARTMYKKQSSLQVVNNIQHYDELYNLNVYDKIGLDGMILPFYKAFDGDQDKDMDKTVWYICYKTNQIKSYDTNNGNFDITKNDINESVQNNEYIAYHGSPNKFKKFDNNFLGTSTSKYETDDIQSAKWGHFFTTDKEYSNLYGKYGYKCKITLNNPLIYDMSEYIATDEKIVKIINQAKENGNDGVILKNIREYGRQPSTEYIVFNSNQIEILDVNSKKSLVSNNINESYKKLSESVFYDGELKYIKQTLYVKIYKDPSQSILKSLLKQGDVRGYFDECEYAYYFWNAKSMNHDAFENNFGETGYGFILTKTKILFTDYYLNIRDYTKDEDIIYDAENHIEHITTDPYITKLYPNGVEIGMSY